jgi:hypothetical protein
VILFALPNPYTSLPLTPKGDPPFQMMRLSARYLNRRGQAAGDRVVTADMLAQDLGRRG